MFVLAAAGLFVIAEPVESHPASVHVEEKGKKASATRSNTEFRVTHHGFAFRNSFTGSPLPASLREAKSGWEKSLKGAIDQNFELPKNFGLCGGMSLAAADFFHAGLAMPNVDKPPEAGTPLYEYLYQRQVESWGAGSLYAIKFLQWMRLPDAGADSPSERSVAEIKTIATKVSAGELVPIGLVLVRHGDETTRNAGKPWENHQVLCWKVEPRGDGSGGSGGTDLHVYDPNFPKDEGVVIRVSNVSNAGVSRAGEPRDAASGEWKKLDPGKPVTLSRLTSAGKATAVRGVFAMPYERKDVPEAVAKEPKDK